MYQVREKHPQKNRQFLPFYSLPGFRADRDRGKGSQRRNRGISSPQKKENNNPPPEEPDKEKEMIGMSPVEIDGRKTISRRITPKEYLEIDTWKEMPGSFRAADLTAGRPVRLRKGFSAVFQAEEDFHYWRARVSAPGINSVKRHAKLWEVLEEIGAQFIPRKNKKFSSLEFILEEKYSEKLGFVSLSITEGGAHRAKQLFVSAPFEQKPLDEIITQ